MPGVCRSRPPLDASLVLVPRVVHQLLDRLGGQPIIGERGEQPRESLGPPLLLGVACAVHLRTIAVRALQGNVCTKCRSTGSEPSWRLSPEKNAHNNRILRSSSGSGQNSTDGNMAKTRDGEVALRGRGLLRLTVHLMLLSGLVAVVMVPPPAFAQKWPVPKGSNMNQYENSLDNYIPMIIKKAKNFEDNDKIEDWAKNRKNKNEYNLGVDQGIRERNYGNMPGMARQEMKKYFGSLDQPKECASPQKTDNGCWCPPFQPEWKQHYYYYWLPVHMVEGGEVAYQTAVVTKQDVKKLRQEAIQYHYQQAQKQQQDVLKKMKQQSQANKFGYDNMADQPEQKGIADAKQAGDDNLLRSQRSDRMLMYAHLFDTGEPNFHEKYKDEYRELWVHNGSLEPQIPILPKPSVKQWLIEEKQSILFARHSYPSYIDGKLKKFTFPKDSKETCRAKYHYDGAGTAAIGSTATSGGHTPKDAIPDPNKQKLDDNSNPNKDRCLPGNLGKVGPFTAEAFQTMYGPTAARVAYHRGATYVDCKLAQPKCEEPGFHQKYHPYRYRGKGMDTADPFVIKIPGVTPRARYQELTQAPAFNPDMEKGCQKFWQEKQYIPNRWGAEDSDGNISRTRTHNFTYEAVVWNPMAGCHFPCARSRGCRYPYSNSEEAENTRPPVASLRRPGGGLPSAAALLRAGVGTRPPSPRAIACRSTRPEPLKPPVSAPERIA